MKKDIKTKKLTAEERHFGVLVEYMDHKWSFVAEQYRGIKEDIEDIKKRSILIPKLLIPTPR
ncbi:MAG: hypothetical protein M1334_01475 [Patescibacteria group bacterium]|nr:hypothetical protein [Patescibacteria group bacterium]